MISIAYLAVYALNCIELLADPLIVAAGQHATRFRQLRIQLIVSVQ